MLTLSETVTHNLLAVSTLLTRRSHLPIWVMVSWLHNHDDAKKTSLDHLAWLGLHLSSLKKFQLPIFGSFSRAWERGWGHLGGLGDSLYHLAGFTAKLYGSQKLFWNCRGSVRSNSLAGDATSDLKISLMERSEHRVKQLQKCWNSNSRSQRIPGDLNFAFSGSLLLLLSQQVVANRSQI